LARRRQRGAENVAAAGAERIAFLTHRDAPTILDTLRRPRGRAAKSKSMHIHLLDLGIVIVYLLGVTALGGLLYAGAAGRTIIF